MDLERRREALSSLHDLSSLHVATEAGELYRHSFFTSSDIRGFRVISNALFSGHLVEVDCC
jgi:hypothetical protein